MCVEPTTALVIGSAVSSGIQYQTGKAQQKAEYQAQKDRNRLARENALQRYATEQLKIRQVVDQNKAKGYEASLRARKARATAVTSAGESGLDMSGSTELLIGDYYRTEGNYKASLARNLKINIDQFERNLEAIEFGAEAQSTYETPPNSALLFASSALNVANTYYGQKAMKDNMKLR